MKTHAVLLVLVVMLRTAASVLGAPVPVTYTNLDNSASYPMLEFFGKNTSVLVMPADLTSFTEAQAWELVDQADYLYETFKELMGVEPRGSGLLRIAFANTNSPGWGLMGLKGIELHRYFATGGVFYRYMRGDLIDLIGYLEHEMTHNFDRWGNHVTFGADTAHAWTAFMDAYIVSANQLGYAKDSVEDLGYSPADILDKRIEDYFGPYLATFGSSWEVCVKNAACANLEPAKIQGGFIARLAKLIGPGGTRRALAELSTAATTRGLNPLTMTPEEKNDLLLECFSKGAQTNLSCVALALRWRAPSPDLQADLTTLYGTNHSACVDADGDSYTPLQGDLNDADSGIHPNATELVNGVDDDCNGIVDEQLVSESADFPDAYDPPQALPLPVRVVGTNGASEDWDFFQISLPAPTTVRFGIKSIGAFEGILVIFDAAMGWWTYMHCARGTQDMGEIQYPAGKWSVAVQHYFYSPPGGYQVTAAAQHWPHYSYPARPVQLASNVWQLAARSVPPDLVGAPGAQSRFWVSGFGWVGTNAIGNSNTTVFTWTAPSNLPPAQTTYRVQFYQHSNAVTRVTEGLPLTGVIPVWPRVTATGDFVMNWSAASAGLSAAAATNFAGPWTVLTNAPAFTNGVFHITTPKGNEPLKLFRLQTTD